MANTATLIAQLRALGHLTQAEAQIARVRVAQARTDAVRGELQQNSRNADERADAIGRQLRDLGAVPDVVSPVLGRAGALVKSTVEQAQPVDEALLSDLALEHQLLDRARYLGVLADAAGEAGVRKLAERLVTAHTATVDWLTTVLAEEALGGPTALRPTPLQRVAGGVTRAVNLPARVAVESVNRALHTVNQTGQEARDKVGEYASRVLRLGSGTREVLFAGRDAALQRAESVARRDGARDTASAVHETRRGLGGLTAGELPIRGYAALSAQDVIARIKKLERTDDINAVLRYEETHKNRSGVVSAAQTRHAALAKEAVGVN
ncbi:ferritin-like domain-containing protein [Pseudonocardia bannensis]|uniref:Ferritin-like domain-containing protein n=1 Tax=Pseudonocardia bannensis TaxID=630973 RepID=A0A848DI78_9PSEU|nr:ferritin-like domain-containing protein [Pseudonocardia bannensis]NMH92259.1 ferritin-like domain-containing protein [Pseudonocardia bannensis]